MTLIGVDKIKSDANGRWMSIYSSLGIDVGAGEHKPCPVCGGEDRFRLTNESGNGEWFCNGCDPKAGDGFSLVMKSMGIDFLSACAEVRGAIGVCEKTDHKKEPNANAKASNIALWRTSSIINGNTPVDKYLRSRGLLFSSTAIRYNAGCWCSEIGSKIPAMVAPVQNPDGRAVSIHRTYLTMDGKKADLEKQKCLTPVSEKISGGAIRLFKPDGNLLGVAEGIETAISCKQLFDVPTWATVSSTIMESFVPPDEVRRISIYADNDANFVGQKSAYRLAERLHKDGFLVEVVIPDEVGDFNDVITKK